MSVFPKDPGPPVYGAYLCSPVELKASYNRCRALRVPVELDKPQKILTKTALVRCLAENSLLLTAVERVITPHHYAGPQNDHIYILCNQKLAALKIFASPEVLAAANEAGVKPGTIFTEESCGTNALALAREHGRITSIRGEQHYCKLFKDWWCVVGPVKDPEDNTMGYLDISMNAEKHLGLAAIHLQTLINSIERELYLWEVERKIKQTGARLASDSAFSLEITRQLTPREQEVLQLLVSGLTNKEIAAKLYISNRTVETHQKNNLP